MSPAIRILIGASLLAAAIKVGGALVQVPWAAMAQWFYVPPLVAALVVAGGMRDRRGKWWLAGLLLSWAGDVAGGDTFLVLLGCFLIAHVCFIVALLPTREDSVLGRRGTSRRHQAIPYLLVGVAGAVVLVPAVGPVLALPVILYAVALTYMAMLASAAGFVGVVGGALFVASDFMLGLTTFVLDVSEQVSTAVVIGTYVPAQVVLLLAFLRLTQQPRRKN